jgi:hypothetical protein
MIVMKSGLLPARRILLRLLVEITTIAISNINEYNNGLTMELRGFYAF